MKNAQIVWVKTHYNADLTRHLVRVVGRIWVTLDNGRRYNLKTMRCEDGRSSLVLDLEAYERETKEAQEAELLRRSIRDCMSPFGAKKPDLEALRKIADILGIKQ